MTVDEYKDFLFRLFVKTSNNDIMEYTHDDTRTYVDHDDYIQMRAISPLYKKDGKSMQFFVRNSWLRLEVIVKINDGERHEYVLYRNVFKFKNDDYKIHIIELYNQSVLNTQRIEIENNPFTENEIRRKKLERLKKDV